MRRRLGLVGCQNSYFLKPNHCSYDDRVSPVANFDIGIPRPLGDELKAMISRQSFEPKLPDQNCRRLKTTSFVGKHHGQPQHPRLDRHRRINRHKVAPSNAGGKAVIEHRHSKGFVRYGGMDDEAPFQLADSEAALRQRPDIVRLKFWDECSLGQFSWRCRPFMTIEDPVHICA